MEKNKIKTSYDNEEDILCLSKGRKVKSSRDIGDFIVDIDKDNIISGVEILNASENLNIKPEQLDKLENAFMTVNYKSNCVYITLILQFATMEKNITIPLSIELKNSHTAEKMMFAAA